jgi:hypothetical protein
VTRWRRGSALIEYVGAVVAVGMVMLGLLALRPHQPARTPPIAPVDRLGGLVAPAPPPPRVAAPPRPRAPRPPRPPRPRPPRPTVLVPGWAVGW